MPQSAPLSEPQRRMLAELAARRDPQERLAWLVTRADAGVRLPAEAKNDATRVPGCLARLWVIGAVHDGQCVFQCDSDSRIVRAVGGFVCEFFSGCTPVVVVAGGLDPLERAGLARLLATHRRNAVARVGERIRELAAGFTDA